MDTELLSGETLGTGIKEKDKRLSLDGHREMRAVHEGDLVRIHSQYAFLQLEGKGSFGNVYKVLDRAEGQIRAMKIVPITKKSTLC